MYSMLSSEPHLANVRLHSLIKDGEDGVQGVLRQSQHYSNRYHTGNVINDHSIVVVMVMIEALHR